MTHGWCKICGGIADIYHRCPVIPPGFIMDKAGVLKKMDLKTLKDIERKINDRTQGAVHFVDSKRLRAVAIKWVKEFDAYSEQECGDGCCHKGDGKPFFVGHSDIKEWIMHFFNLSEEELK